MFLSIGVGTVVLIVVLIVIVLMLLSCVRVVKQTDEYIIQRLGKYHATWSVGIHFLAPFFDKVERVVTMKEQLIDYDPQPVITKDNVTMLIDTVVFFQVTDSKLYTYGVTNPMNAIEKLTSTTLRNIIGELDLDQTLTSRDTINAKMCDVLDKATDPWGIKVNRVEVKNIQPPKDIREAMEKQMRAERERREKILSAEGEKESAIKIAEGKKQSAILEAEATKERLVREAEGEKQATILKAEAEAEAIRIQAEADANKIKVLKDAEAYGINQVKEAKADEAVLKLESYKALVEVAQGQATKIIIPSEIQSLAGLVTAAKEVATDPKKA